MGLIAFAAAILCGWALGLVQSGGTVTTRLADILESRQLARKPTKKKLVEILRNDPVLLREVPEWSSTFEAMIEPQLVNMPENDKEFAAKLPEMQQQFREVAQQLSSPEVLEQYTDFMREAIADPTQLMGNLQGAMEEVMQSPDFEQRMEEAFNTIQDPEFMKNVEDTWRAMGSTEDQIAEMRKMWEDPAIKDQIRELFQNPEAMQETIQMMGMGGGMGGAPLGRVEL
uniref:STI1 domain-containing protein n=1 Tax=Phaeomonas parva TaxID=124430 RepID=A0A6U4G6Z2_9STRA|mmetsp:Transcript_29201/g.93505  ORF Transcript_29201/g.93505 Transcript_29201/m.93505 type:complete len:228 (+) Transcript_29201:468-1151(+)